jgi:acetylornithine/N-succinyldiaminopimelate aminotransferase
MNALLPVFARADIAFEKGEGSWLTTTDGRKFLDFGSGIAVNSFGHAHPHLMKALTEQAGKVWHVSNLFRIPGAEKLAERLVAASFADQAFFCNSGAEANEAAIKMARKYFAATGRPERFRIVTFEGAFHGRTLATLAAGGQQKYLEGFGPKAEGFDQVPFGDWAALKAAIGPTTAALMIEPIQGEGGVRPVPQADMRRLREICDENGLLLVLDEIQTGIGRTGKLFAHEWSGVKPDIMSLAKAIGGGFPLGAVLSTAEAGKGMTAGTHGTTFGGNPLAVAVGNAVLDLVLAPGLLDRVNAMSLTLKQGLESLKDRYPAIIEEIRGQGFHVGIKTKVPNTDFAAKAREVGLLTIPAGDNVVRVMPPLNVTEADLRVGLDKLDQAAAKSLAALAPPQKAAS